MRGITKSTIFCSLTFLLLAGPRVSARAQEYPEYLNVALTATVQLPDPDPSGKDGEIQKHVTKSVKWTSASLLNLIQTSQSTSFSGGKLALVDGSPTVVDKNGTTDVSSHLSVDTDGDSVSSGQENSNTGAQNRVTAAVVTVTFDDGNGNSFSLTGVIKETYSLARAREDKEGNSLPQSESVSFSGTFVGSGQVGGNSAVFSGTISGSGHGSIGG